MQQHYGNGRRARRFLRNYGFPRSCVQVHHAAPPACLCKGKADNFCYIFNAMVKIYAALQKI